MLTWAKQRISKSYSNSKYFRKILKFFGFASGPMAVNLFTGGICPCCGTSQVTCITGALLAMLNGVIAIVIILFIVKIKGVFKFVKSKALSWLPR